MAVKLDAPIHVDLATTIIPANRKVWIVRPGKGYRLYDLFVREHAIFVELPDLDLTVGRKLSQHDKLDARVRRSRAIRAWHIETKREGERPDLALDTYVTDKKDGSVTKLLGITKTILETINVGDLVVVPPWAYSKEALIGEVVDGADKHITRNFPDLYGESVLTGRRVNWLPGIQKRRLPTSILDAISKPLAVYLLEKSLTPIIYETAFESFVDLSRGDPVYTSTFRIGAETFKSDTDLAFQAFVNFVAANLEAASRDGGERQSLLDVLLDADAADRAGYTPEMKSNINSPGTITFIGKKISPLVIGLLFALATDVGPLAAELAQVDGMIVVGNSKGGPDDACTVPVHASTIATLKLLGIEEWAKACSLAQAAKEKGAVTTIPKVQPR